MVGISKPSSVADCSIKLICSALNEASALEDKASMFCLALCNSIAFPAKLAICDEVKSITVRPEYSKRLKRRHQGFGDTFYIDEVFVKIRGKQYYLWRAVDQDGEVVDVFLQARRDGAAAKRFFRRLKNAAKMRKWHLRAPV